MDVEDTIQTKDLTKKLQLDSSNSIIVVLAIELPFWIPIKSGEYNLMNDRMVKVRNDLWLISIANIVDGPIDQPFDYIVNEMQVADKEFLERKTRGTAQYFHKKKMKTTLTQAFTIVPIKGVITAKALSKEWQRQIDQVVFGMINQEAMLENFLDDTNLFIDQYSTLINPQNPSREVRQINFFETAVNARIIFQNEEFHYENITKITPDLKMADLPFPSFKVGKSEKLRAFREKMQNLNKPAFHQLQWVKVLNYRRERRYQEALLGAAITLETLVHLYLKAQDTSWEKEMEKLERKNRGMATWIRILQPQGLVDECEEVSKLWLLRNEVVHEQRILTEDDVELIRNGIQSLERLRPYLLHISNPDLLKLENQFSSFLEKILLGEAASDSIGKLVLLKYEWRREQDCYQTVVELMR